MFITLYAESRNGRLKYYTIHDRQPTLDSPFVLTTAWRNENARERERQYVFENARQMSEKLRELFRRTTRRGYRLLYRYDREDPGRFGRARDSIEELEEYVSAIESRRRA